ncbi:alpha/beta hydrolase [Massilia sp. B-10]|nr:alpha/beta hydrolase [Massilia sp. B-10]
MPALVAPQVHQLAAADGTSLHVSDFVLPANANRGCILLMHGLGEHSGRYRHLAHFFNDLGLSVRCYDHRGHGRSGGTRGDVINGDPMLQDAQIVIEHFAARFSSLAIPVRAQHGRSVRGPFRACLARRRCAG